MDDSPIDDKKLQHYARDVDSLIKDFYSSHKYCMAYTTKQCEGKICNAHTISKKYLQKISNDLNQIYLPLHSGHHKNNFYVYKLKGITPATTFTGFCAYHDKELFKSFEDVDFTVEYKKIYDISFRALCREYFQKKCANDFCYRLKYTDLKKLDKTCFTQSSWYDRYVMKIMKELKDHKFLYEQLKKYSNSGLQYIVVEVNKCLPISTTGVLFPLFDGQGQKIQNERRAQLGFIYNIISLADRSYMIISTVKTLHNNAHRQYFNSLLRLNDHEIINLFLTNSFFNNDSVAIKPAWHDDLDDAFKANLDELMNNRVGNYLETSYSKVIDFTQYLPKFKLTKKHVFD